jgi:hypothetical protein
MAYVTELSTQETHYIFYKQISGAGLPVVALEMVAGAGCVCPACQSRNMAPRKYQV